MYRSPDFYMKVYGSYGLFTSPSSKASGDRYSYSIPTQEALRGIVDAVYFKPTLVNKVNEVKVINKITTESMGARTLLGNGANDLNQYTYLRDVEYLIKFHFEWNMDREDLVADRDERKHEAIMKRSLKKGGRRDVFLGTRECLAYIDEIDETYYKEAKSYYDGETISFGIMFNSFKYPTNSGEPLIAQFSEIIMKDGVINYEDNSDYVIENVLNTYSFKYPEEVKPVDEEYKEYERFEEGL